MGLLFDKQSIFGLVSISFIGNVVGKLFRYGLNVVISRGFGIGALGVFAFGLVVMRMGSLVARFGFDKSVQKFVPEYRTENDQEGLHGVVYFSLAVPLVLGITIAASIYLTPIGDMGSKLRLFALLIPLHAVLMVGINITRGFKRTRYAVYIRDLFHSGLSVALAITAAYVFDSFDAAIAGYFVSLLLSNLLMLYYVRQLGGFSFDDPVQIESRRILTFSAPLALLYFAQHFVSWADIFVLTFFTTSSDVGLYQVAFQTSVIVTFVLSAVNTIFPSLSSELYADGKMDELERMYRTVTKWSVTISVLVYISLWTNIELISVVFDITAVSIEQLFVILGLGQVMAVAAGPTNYLLVMSENERLETVNVVAASLLNLMMNVVLVNYIGVVGAAIATATTYGLLNAARIAEINLRLGINLFDRTFFRNLLVLVPPVSVFALYQYSAVQNIYLDAVATVVVGGCYLCSIAYVGVSHEDRQLFRSVDDAY